jgi:hypothetical protein
VRIVADGRAIVAVCPPRECARRSSLFHALERAFPVRFEGRHAQELRGADGALLIGVQERDAPTHEVPLLSAVSDEPEPSSDPGPLTSDVPSFRLAASELLDRRLRGQVIRDPAADTASVPVADGDVVLASCDRAPLWITRGRGAARRDVVALAPRELGPEEALRGRIQEGRALALLPLLHFLRELTAGLAFHPPPLRAAFLIDDPNLHWTGYGYLRYHELARHADEHGYHVAMAMVPLDGWATHPGAARLFRERSDRLSLTVHGNDHVWQELGRPMEPRRRRALLSQALRRIASFEERTRLRVARVMTAPHEDCSEEMARDMLRLGIEALCNGRPYPWMARAPAPWLSRPEGTSPLVAFGPATPVVGGLPVLLRRPLDSSPADVALCAYLDQPLILYGHHDDLEGGLEPFADWAARVNELGSARWGSLARIAATNYATRREGDLLRVRLYARRVRVEVPAGIERLRVELPEGDGRERVVYGGSASGALGADLPLGGGERGVDVALARTNGLDPATVPAPLWRPWPLVRRFAGEGRDRLAPLYGRVTRA